MKHIPEGLLASLKAYSDWISGGKDYREMPTIAQFQGEMGSPVFGSLQKLISRRKKALSKGDVKESAKLLSEAKTAALNLLRERTLQVSLEDIRPENTKGEIERLIHYCSVLLDVLNGEEVKNNSSDSFVNELQRLVNISEEYDKEHNEKPTKQVLRKQYGFRADFLAELHEDILVRFLSRGKTGPKKRSEPN